MTLPLFERWPGTAALTLAGIAEIPTPLDDASAFASGSMGGRGAFDAAGLWFKRDDLTSPHYGGNKVRKLDFLLGDAQASGHTSVLTFGAYGSNHALATAVFARRLGLEPHVVLSPQEPGPFAPRTLRAHAALGTVIHLVDGWDGRREAVRAKQEIEARDGHGPYIIPMGGTCPVGAVGFVNGALEVLGQFEAQAPGRVPDVVYVAGGTLGTAVGLAAGFAAAGTPTRVEAVRVTPVEVGGHQLLEKAASGTLELLRSLDDSFPPLGVNDLRISLREEFYEPGYGVATPETLDAVRIAEEAGLHLETTYTGKAFHAMLADAADGRLSGENVVFWNTYNSAPYPAAGDDAALPETLRDYIAECERLFPELP